MAHGTSRCCSSNYLVLDSFVQFYIECVVNAGVNVVVDVLRRRYRDSTFRVYNSVNVIRNCVGVCYVVLPCGMCNLSVFSRTLSQNTQKSSPSVW